jgi:hypothetical protein
MKQYDRTPIVDHLERFCDVTPCRSYFTSTTTVYSCLATPCAMTEPHYRATDGRAKTLTASCQARIVSAAPKRRRTRMRTNVPGNKSCIYCLWWGRWWRISCTRMQLDGCMNRGVWTIAIEKPKAVVLTDVRTHQDSS